MTVDSLTANDIPWGRMPLTMDRPSMASWLDTAGITALGPTSAPEHVEAALIRLRELLSADLDPVSRQTLRLDVRRHMGDQAVPHTAAMIDAALAPPPDEPAEAVPRKSQATRLVDLALAAGVELWHTPTGDAYVTLQANGHREHHRLSTGAVRDWLARRHHAETRGAPGRQAIVDALTVLSGMARYDGAEQAIAIRVGGGSEKVFLDLGDPSWRGVEITPAGWRVVTNPPVRLVRSRGMLPLPEPTRSGSIADLRTLVHVASDGDYRLLIGWLLGALRPTGPYPLLSLVGEQGSGKSTAARVVRRLIDPNVAELRAEPRTMDDIMIAATRSRVVALDNLSRLPPWLSDALCRVSTGGALTKRELYSNDDETIIEAVRPTIVTSIADIVTRGDLLDRAIAVTLPVLPEGDRLPETKLWRRFDAAAPGILGALLDGVVSALARERTTKIDALPRMADWAVWVTAAEPALGWPEQSILSAYRTMRGMAIEATLDGDPLAVAVRGLSRPWEGTAANLLTRVTPAGRRPPWLAREPAGHVGGAPASGTGTAAARHRGFDLPGGGHRRPAPHRHHPRQWPGRTVATVASAARPGFSGRFRRRSRRR